MEFHYQVTFSFKAESDEMANDVAHTFARGLQKLKLLPYCKVSEKLLETEAGTVIKRAVWER